MLQRPRGSGLALTLPQARKLWALDESTCRDRRGSWRRASCLCGRTCATSCATGKSGVEHSVDP